MTSPSRFRSSITRLIVGRLTPNRRASASSLGGKTPYDLFVAEHGEEGRAFLDRLGIRRIPAAQVTLHPFLLGQKCQRAADRAILKRNGVSGRAKTETKK